MRRGGGFNRKFTGRHRSGRQGPIAELHHFDASIDGTAPSFLLNIGGVGRFYMLNNMQEGVSSYQRVGRKINMKSILIRMAVVDLPALVLPANADVVVVRLALVYDGQSNGGFPSQADLFAGIIASGGTPTYHILAPVNLNNRDRFLVLKDKIWTFPVANTGSMAAASANYAMPGRYPMGLKWYVNLKGLETIYSVSNPLATLMQAAGITTGGLFLYIDAVSMNEAGVSTSLDLDAQTCSRLRFYD